MARWIAGLFAAALAASPLRAEPALWVAHGPHATVYLLGSLHILRPGTAWEGPAIRRVFDQADELWFEIDLDRADDATVLGLQLGLDLQHRLTDQLTDAQAARLEAAARKAGYPSVAGLQQLRPWMAALVLSLKPLIVAGYDPMLGADHELQTQGKAAHKPIHGLEQAAAQVHMLADLPAEMGVQLLLSTMDSIDALLPAVDGMVTQWAAGDTVDDEMTAQMGERFPELYRRVIVDRNRAWTGEIKELLDGDHVVLITVGAAHLQGPDSVQAMLARDGVQFERAAP